MPACLDMAMFWALPWAVLLLAVASYPVKSEELIVGKISDTIPCKYCNGIECVDTTNCPYLCTGQCPTGFYSVRVIQSSKCASLSGQMDELPAPEIKGVPIQPAEETPAATVATTSTTPAPLLWVCKRCSLDGCLRCEDDVEEPECETCADGYFFLSNSSHTCAQPEVEVSALGAGPVVGIVIACLVLVGVAAVGVWFIVRRFHRSRDLSHADEKVNTGAEERHVWRRSCESIDVAGLGIAPQLPGFDPKDNGDVDKSYDALVKGDQNEQSSYAPLNQSQENLYTNTSSALADNTYGNVPRIGAAETQANSGFSRKNPPLAAISQESGDFYEAVAGRSSAENSLGDFGTDNSHLPIQIVEDNAEEFYANCNVENTDDIYQNM